MLRPDCATASFTAVHGYWDIDVETLVATAADDLAPMIAELEVAVAALQKPDASG